MPWTGSMRPNRDLSFVVTNELAVRPVVTSFTITEMFNALSSLRGGCTAAWKRPWGGLEEALLWPHGPYRIKLTFILSKNAVRHSQGSVGAHTAWKIAVRQTLSQQMSVWRSWTVDWFANMFANLSTVHGHWFWTSRPLGLRPTPWGTRKVMLRSPRFLVANRPHGERMPYVTRV